MPIETEPLLNKKLHGENSCIGRSEVMSARIINIITRQKQMISLMPRQLLSPGKLPLVRGGVGRRTSLECGEKNLCLCLKFQ